MAQIRLNLPQLKGNTMWENKYLPSLILKPHIYLTAFNNLDNMLDYVPIFELFDDGFDMGKLDKNQKFFLNILDKSNGNDVQYLYDFYSKVKTTHKNFIPVIDDTVSFGSKKTTFRAFRKMDKNFDAIAIKLNGIEPLLFDGNLESMLFFCSDMSKLYFILDVEKSYRYTVRELERIFSNAIDYIRDEIDNDIVNFIINGSLLEVSSKNHISIEESGEPYHKIDNTLLAAHEVLVSKYSDINLLYSDYTIDEKHIFKDRIDVRAFYPSIKYTDQNGDILVFKSNSLSDFSKYSELCKKIISIEEFDKNHCHGCKKIYDVSKSGTGAPGSWKSDMMVHHMTRMHEILTT